MASKFVEEEIKKNQVVVFSKTWCGYSSMAKKSLYAVTDKEKITVIELDKRPDGSAIQNYLAQKTKGNTVPKVFINGEFIGGGTETKAKEKSGELKKLIEGCA